MHELPETGENASYLEPQDSLLKSILAASFRIITFRPSIKLSGGNLGIVARLILGCNVKNL
jgi:hypothetical protein